MTAALTVLAADQNGTAGPLGLVVVTVLGVAVFLLYRSMVKHLRRVPASFDAPPADPAAPPPAGEPDDPPRA